MIKGKQPEEIRKLYVHPFVLAALHLQPRDPELTWHPPSRFNIVNDFTPEEEAQIKKENEWAVRPHPTHPRPSQS
jgi:hypothetical protein